MDPAAAWSSPPASPPTVPASAANLLAATDGVASDWLRMPRSMPLISRSTNPNCQVTEIEIMGVVINKRPCSRQNSREVCLSVSLSVYSFHLLSFWRGTRNFLSSTQQMCLHKSLSFVNTGHVQECGSPKFTYKWVTYHLIMCNQNLITRMSAYFIT